MSGSLERIEAEAAELLARIEKEIAREGGPIPSTAAVGGVTKTGTQLQRFAKAVAIHAATSQALDLSQELRRRGLTRGAGTYLRLADELLPRAAVGSPMLDAVSRDVRLGRRSRLLRLADLRNSATHEDGPPPTAELKRVLAEAAAWLRPLVARRSRDQR